MAGEVPRWRSDPKHFQIAEDCPPSLLGSGSYGSVWKVKHGLDEGEYAIKQISVAKAFKHFGGNINRLFEEAKALSNITSENIVRYHTSWLEGPDLGKITHKEFLQHQSIGSSATVTSGDKFFFIQMELCQSTLKEWLKLHPDLETRVPEIQDILSQLAQALVTIHDLNIVHRDLKPDNLLSITRRNKTNGQNENIWKIGDFGLARTIEGNLGPSELAGNRFYRSPDQQSSLKSDVYSLGLIFLEVLYPAKSGDYYSMFWDFGNKPDTIVTEVQQLIQTNFPKECDIICDMLNPDSDLRIDAQRVHDLLTAEYIPKLQTISTDQRNPLSNTSKNFPGKLRNWRPKPMRQFQNQLNQQKIPNFSPCWFDIGNPTNNFVGRETQLEELRSYFEDNKFLVVISGLGGIGKSELVRYFATMVYEQINGSCIWLRGESSSTLKLSVEELALKAGVKKNAKIWTMFEEIYTKLKNSPILLIIDNVDKVNHDVEDLIRNFRKLPPKSEHPFIIITTRNRAVISLTGGEFMELKVFDSIDANKLVTITLPKSKPEDAGDLCESLQNFPLAIQQAIGYIQQRQKTSSMRFGIKEYLKLFQTQQKKILDEKLPLIDHDYSLTTLTTWQISFDSIKSDERLGVIAEEIFDTWAYALNPDGEELQFVVDFIRTVNKIKNPESELFDNLGHNDAKSSKDMAEVDILDDCRPIAQAILLIRNFSMCNVDMRFKLGSDHQFVSIHRLVQEVIRVSKSKSQEIHWLSDFGKSLIYVYNRVWNDQVCLPREKDILLKTWDFISKHDQLIRELKELVVVICDPKLYLPISSKEFLSKTHQLLQRVVGDEDFVTMLVELNFCHVSLIFKSMLSENVPIEEDSVTDSDSLATNIYPFNILQLTDLFKRMISILGHQHQLTRKTLTMLAVDLPQRSVAVQDGIDVEDLIVFLFELVKIASSQRSEIFPEFQLLWVLCITGKILENLEPQDDVLNFACRFVTIFKTESLDPRPFLYVFIYVEYFIRDILKLLNEWEKFISLLKFELQISPKDLELGIKELSMLNEIIDIGLCHDAPLSVLNKMVSDLLHPDAEVVKELGINCILKYLSHRNDGLKFVVGFAKKALDLCLRLYQLEKSEIADSFISTAMVAEEIVWTSGKLSDSVDICQNLLPIFEFKESFKDPSLVTNWVDGILTRIGGSDELNQRHRLISMLLMKLNSLTTALGPDVDCDYLRFLENMYDIKDPVVLLRLGEDMFSSFNDSLSLESLSFIRELVLIMANCLWNLNDFDTWKSFCELAIPHPQSGEINKSVFGANVYLRSKIAEHISTSLSIDRVREIPLSVTIWGFLFQLRNHTKLAGSNSNVLIQDIVTRFEENSISSDELFQLGLDIANICDTLLKSRTLQDNFWYCFHFLEFIGDSFSKLGQCDEQLVVLSVSLNLIETSFSFHSVVLKILELLELHIIAKKFKPKWDIKIFVQILCDIFRHLIHNNLSINIMYRTTESIVEEMIAGWHFKEIVQFNESLLEVSSKPNRLSQDFSVQKIAKKLRRPFEENHLIFFETALREARQVGTTIIVKKEIITIISEFINLVHFDIRSHHVTEAEQVFRFILKHGPQSTINLKFLNKICTYYLKKPEYMELYYFGGSISKIKKEELKLELLYSEAVQEVVRCLRTASEDDVETFQRTFATLKKVTNSGELNNRNEFEELVDVICKECKIKREEEAVDEDQSDEVDCD